VLVTVAVKAFAAVASVCGYTAMPVRAAESALAARLSSDPSRTGPVSTFVLPAAGSARSTCQPVAAEAVGTARNELVSTMPTSR
jgi:hypothetical protein